jgi:hypothetical protein
MTASAAPVEEPGFWPVTRLPSIATTGLPVIGTGVDTTTALQHVFYEVRHDLGKATASSSVLLKPVTLRRRTSAPPSAALVCRRTADAWHTVATLDLATRIEQGRPSDFALSHLLATTVEVLGCPLAKEMPR